jgi:N-methylhydantoinase B
MSLPDDPLAIDLLWSRLIATVNEQAAALMRTSFSSIVRDAGDLSAAAFDRRGRMVAQAVTGTPGHINSLATGMRYVLDRYPVDTMAEGDVIVTNDPWKTASQLHDLSVITPMFHKGKLVAFFASCCHTPDIGGRGLSADARSIHEEGLFIPIMKMMEKGKMNETFQAFFAANVRTPLEGIKDLEAQMIGNQAGADQLASFLESAGLDDIEALSDVITDRSEAAMRARVAELEDGDYEAALACDGFEEPLTLKIRLAVRGNTITARYIDVPPRAEFGINVALNYTAAYTLYGLKCALSPDIPNNDGALRPIIVDAPAGSLLAAEYPAAVCGRHMVGHYLPSLVFRALANARPEAVLAGGYDALWESHVFGDDDGTGAPFSFTWFSSGGGGAIHGLDGLSATAFPSGVAATPIEVAEERAPLRFLHRKLREGSGGRGTWSGGLGQSIAFEIGGAGSVWYSGMYDRIKTTAPGLFGGEDGAAGSVVAEPGGELSSKALHRLEPGTVIHLELPGGGGYGAPEDPV